MSTTTRKVRLKRRAPKREVDPKKAALAFGSLLILCIATFFVVINYVVEQDQSKLNRTADLESQGLYFTLEMDKSRYKLGEPIDVKLSVRNITSSPITLKFDQDQEFDFLVQKEMNLLFAQVPMNVWRFSNKQIPHEDPHSITIPPGKVRVFSGTWEQEDAKGKTVRPGQYVITGYLRAENRNETLQLRGATK
ncbi:MAG: BsuPI-related putative proteinase inhibitor [Vulcanimicrobiota bacterium]